MGASARASLAGVVGRGAQLVDVLASRRGVRACLTYRPFSLSAFRLVRALEAEGLSFATVIDVGANTGQFARAALGAWPAAQVIAMEPLPGAAAALAAGVGRRGRVEVRVTAVGAEDGAASFHPHRHVQSSSVLPVVDSHRDEPWAAEEAVITVPLGRLDSVLAHDPLARPALLKIDVQGFEREVLDGAPATLARIDAVLVECAFRPRYEGQPTFTEVHDDLVGRGWTLVRPLDVHRDGMGGIVEADFLYVPDTGVVPDSH